jgi:hypothetical protein
MAHLENGKVDVATLSVFGGTAVMLGDAVNVAGLQAAMRPGQTLNVVAPEKPISRELSVKEESPLEIIGKETIEINKTEIAVKPIGLLAATTLRIYGQPAMESSQN